jgi:hypothetical protein
MMVQENLILTVQVVLMSSDDSDDSDDSDEGVKGKGDSQSNSSKPSASSSGDATPDKVRQDILEAVKNVQEAVLAEVMETASSIVSSVKKEKFNRLFDNPEIPSSTIPAPSSYKALASNFSSALSKLKADTDNQWESGKQNGKFNTLLSIESRDLHFDVFDEWMDEGDDRPDAEVVILLDQSSSMQNHVGHWDGEKVAYDWGTSFSSVMAQASASMWAIKYACSKHEIPCSVLGYDDEFRALYSADSVVHLGSIPMFGSRGGTQPDEAVSVAIQILKKSNAKHKLLFSITDGEWLSDHKTQCEIQGLEKLGISTFLIQLPKGMEEIYSADGKSVIGAKPRFSEGINGGEETGYHDRPARVFPKWYGHKALIQAQDCTSLTKNIGRHILQAVISA